MKKIIAFILIAVALSGCAKKYPVESCVTNTHQYGFWGGLWHGMIMVPDFIGMLIWDDVTVYATDNNGGWYAFGFIIGAGAILSGGTKATNKN